MTAHSPSQRSRKDYRHLDSSQSLFEIPPDVLLALDSAAEAHQIIPDTILSALLWTLDPSMKLQLAAR